MKKHKKQQKSTNQNTKRLKKRNRETYPALGKSNLNSRKPFIETDYINGVKNLHGETVIRPLTDKEKQFLNDFYEETIITNFLHDEQLRRLNQSKKGIIEDDIVQSLKKEIKRLEGESEANNARIVELKEIIKITKKQNKETYEKKLNRIEKKMQDRREDVLLYPDKEDHKVFYNENNARNKCAYTKKQMLFLDDLPVDESNNYYLQTDECWEDTVIDKMVTDHFQKIEDHLVEIEGDMKYPKKKS